MPQAVVVIKIDPEKRQIARLAIKPSVAGVRQILGAADFGHKVLLDEINGEQLLVASRFNVDPEKPLKEWRIRGGDNTAGIGLLFGTFNRNAGGPGMWHSPVDVVWCERMIVWCEPGENAPASEVRAAQGIATPADQERNSYTERVDSAIAQAGARNEGWNLRFRGALRALGLELQSVSEEAAKSHYINAPDAWGTNDLGWPPSRIVDRVQLPDA